MSEPYGSNDQCEVDVIIPAYNYGRYLDGCLTSVLEQTFGGYSVLVIDNASEDDTEEVARRWVRSDSRFSYIRNETNIGLRDSSLKAYAHTRAKWVLFLSADDLLKPRFLEMAVSALRRHPECTFAYSAWRMLVDNPGGLRHGEEIDVQIPHDRSGCYDESGLLLSHNWITNSFTLFRREACESAGGFMPAGFSHFGDWYLWMRLSAKGPAFYINEHLGLYRSHGRSESDRLIANHQSGFDHIYFHDKIFESDLWPWPVRLLAKANQIRWLTGEPLTQIARKMGGAAAEPRVRGFVDRHRSRFWTEVARSVLHYKNSIIPNFLDTPENGLALLREALQHDPHNAEAAALLEHHREGRGDYREWSLGHRWDAERCRRLLAGTDAPETIVDIHVLVVDRGDRNLLADTIDDLAAQALANWRLTVVSETARPESAEPIEMIEWAQVSGQSAVEAIAASVVASAARWFVCFPAGVRLSPAFTLLAGLRLRERPDSLLLYLDEDAVDADGEHAFPRFKPDVNVDFLRSYPYVGAATLISRSVMLDPRIAILPVGLPRNYGAALLAIERTPSAVEHLDEVLVHVPEPLAAEFQSTELARLLVEQHLARCGIAAEVSDGSLAGSLVVEYLLPAQPPMVSVLILVRDNIEHVQLCLEALLEKTRYPSFEVLAVVGPDTPQPVLAYLADLAGGDARVRPLRHEETRDGAAIRHLQADRAVGEYLVLLDDDVAALQDNWLARLVAMGLRPEVGAVGCRLLALDRRVRHAGMILGIGGAIDRIGAGLTLTESGYMGRVQLAQNFSAVSAACMLVRKSLFLEVGGFVEAGVSAFSRDGDLCLKIGDRGFLIVWTPHVTMVCHGSRDEWGESDADPDKRQQSARRAFVKKWLHRLGNDPAYNRHLSLRQREWMIDGDFDVPWHPGLEPLPRIVAQPPDEMGVGQYRMIGPLKELTDSGRICSFLLPALTSDKRFLPYVSELIRAKPTVFFLQNAFSDFHLDDLQQYADLLPDLFRVFGQDDIVFSVPQKSAARKHFGKDTKARVRKAVSLCHRAIVTTEPIAEAMRGMLDDIRVMPNYLERFRWGDLQAPRNERRKPRVGWAGAQQHQGDLEFILPVVEATANEVDWIFMGMYPPKLRYHVAETHPAVAFDQYPAALAKLDLDLAIAPLELNRFNAAKSNLRLLEYGAVGYPVIATDILPYRNAPVTRVPNNPQAWVKAIREHICELEATRAAGERLRQWVLSDWMLDQHLDEWLRVLLPD